MKILVCTNKHSLCCFCCHFLLKSRAVAEYLSCDLPYKLCTDDIFLTSGGTQAIEIVMSVFGQPGANILLPKPGYPKHEAHAVFHRMEVRLYDLVPERGWEINVEAVEALADENTVAIVITNPNNPCGNVYTYEHLSKVGMMAVQCWVTPYFILFVPISMELMCCILT